MPAAPEVQWEGSQWQARQRAATGRNGKRNGARGGRSEYQEHAVGASRPCGAQTRENTDPAPARFALATGYFLPRRRREEVTSYTKFIGVGFLGSVE